MNDAKETPAETKVAALEHLITAYFDPKHQADIYADHARHIVDLIDDNMKESERNAAWLLIKYAKKREAEFRCLQQQNAGRKGDQHDS